MYVQWIDLKSNGFGNGLDAWFLQIFDFKCNWSWCLKLLCDGKWLVDRLSIFCLLVDQYDCAMKCILSGWRVFLTKSGRKNPPVSLMHLKNTLLHTFFPDPVSFDSHSRCKLVRDY